MRAPVKPRRRRVPLIGTLLAAASLVAVPTLGGASHLLPVQGRENLVLNPDLEVNLGGWTADGDASRPVLRRVPIGAGHFAVEVDREAGKGSWSMLLVSLNAPAQQLRANRTYRLDIQVRDLDASGMAVGLLLANANYGQRPSTSGLRRAYRDTDWHTLSTRVVATTAGGAGTGLYVELPESGRIRLQFRHAEVLPVDPYHVPHDSSAPNRQLTFAGPAGARVNPAEWTYDVGGHGWGNRERQTYTQARDNSQLDGEGGLRITARREDITGEDGIFRRYSSARLVTQGRVSVPPGSYVEAPVRAPSGAGAWSAFWLLGSDLQTVGWPACGEIDIAEIWGEHPSTLHGAIHVAGLRPDGLPDPSAPRTAGTDTDLGAPSQSRPQVVGAYFDEHQVRLYVNRKLRWALTADEAAQEGLAWPFGHSMFLLLSLAVGGDLGAAPARSTFPATLHVGTISIWTGGVPF